MRRSPISRGYVVQTVQTTENSIGIMRYNIEFAYGDRPICKLSTGCIGEQAEEYWHNYGVKVMKRYMYLINSIDHENGLLLEYSTNEYLDEAKDGYGFEWLQTKENLDILHEWLQDMTDGFGNKIKVEIINEFQEYYE
jgi:hypothetical protein